MVLRNDYGLDVGQAFVRRLLAVSSVPSVISLCVLVMMLAAATVPGWRFCMHCWVRLDT